MEKKDAIAYESPDCRVLLLQPGRLLDGSPLPSATTKNISYEDI